MEPNQQTLTEETGGHKFLCRQSSARWTPTADQVRILKELYYNNGLRSPSADQIQRISARLRQYGKIEGKNVFYWFQNHKARERQKKRFGAAMAAETASATATQQHPHRRQCHHNEGPMQRASSRDHHNVNGVWRTEEDGSFRNRPYSNINIPSGYYPASSASASVICSANGTTAHLFESVSMEKHFRDCSISPAGGSHASPAGSSNRSLSSLVGIDPRYYTTRPFDFFGSHERRNSASREDKDEVEREEHLEKRRTLPLFPINPSEADDLDRRWYRSDENRDRDGVSYSASLELSLNSYAGVSSD